MAAWIGTGKKPHSSGLAGCVHRTGDWPRELREASRKPEEALRRGGSACKSHQLRQPKGPEAPAACREHQLVPAWLGGQTGSHQGCLWIWGFSLRDLCLRRPGDLCLDHPRARDRLWRTVSTRPPVSMKCRQAGFHCSHSYTLWETVWFDIRV